MAVARILSNLLSNAIKYTRKGFVRLDTSFDTTGSGQVYLIVDVVDSGAGIPYERQETLFNKSSSAENGGGIGLAITKALVDMMNGEIAVESAEGIGSTFRLKIPFDIAMEAAV
ncbi:MAG: ATP-binding protein [Alphaproteobacteria bacterium]|nr:ATP-binding protein [Alphaproteobacteria bacterium]